MANLSLLLNLRPHLRGLWIPGKRDSRTLMGRPESSWEKETSFNCPCALGQPRQAFQAPCLWTWCHNSKTPVTMTSARGSLCLRMPLECVLIETKPPGPPSSLPPSPPPFTFLEVRKPDPAARGGGLPSQLPSESSVTQLGRGVFMSSRNGCKNGTLLHLWPGHPIIYWPLDSKSFQRDL